MVDRPAPSRRALLQSAALAGAAVVGSSPATAQEDPNLIPDGPTVGLEPVAEGLTAPIALTAPEEDRDRLFVADQPGQVYAVEDGERSTFLDVSDRVVDLQRGFDERGLLGIAFHPEFPEDGRLFVRYSSPPREGTPEGWSHTGVIAAFEADGDGADPDSERTILELPQPQFNHNAGPIAFGPEGYLHVTVGDGGGQYDAGRGHPEDWYDASEGGNGQDTSEHLLGGVLRIDVDGGDPYAIPEDNPLAGEEGHRGEYYAWGMRNPWGLTVAGDDLLAVDVAQDALNRVNHVEAGGNYGWNVREGSHCHDPDSSREPPADCPDATPEDVRGGEPLRDPVAEYPQRYPGEPDRTAVIGGHVYEGAVESLRGDYVFGDWSGSLLVARVPDGWPETNDPDPDFADRAPADADTPLHEERWEGLWPIEQLEVAGADGGNVSLDRFVIGLGRDSEGEVYVLTSGERGPSGDTGRVHRIVPAEGDEAATDGEATAETASEDGEDDGEESDGGGENGEATAGDSIPGFGALAAVAGVAGGLGARLRLGGDEDGDRT